MSKTPWLIPVIFSLVFIACSGKDNREKNFFSADDERIQYVGRIDNSNPALPRYWQPGVYFQVKFEGRACDLIFNDEMLWGNNRNYIQIIVDGRERRLQLKGARDTVGVPGIQGDGWHTLTVAKNTEANVGYMEFVGLRAAAIATVDSMAIRKIEFIGNSITCGMGSDDAEIPCKKREWYDQHNAWRSYGSLAARALNAQFHLSSVSGIGLMHSCCDLSILMPTVYEKINMHGDSVAWDFNRFQPDLVSICLGQNDGVQDRELFKSNYIAFVEQVMRHNPAARILLLSSPMADAGLREFLREELTQVTAHFERLQPGNVSMHVFEKSYNNGCDNHPNISEHAAIAAEVQQVIREKMNW